MVCPLPPPPAKNPGYAYARAVRVHTAQTEDKGSVHREHVKISGLGGFTGVGRNAGRNSLVIRDEYSHYFNNDRAVELQDKMV